MSNLAVFGNDVMTQRKKRGSGPAAEQQTRRKIVKGIAGLPAMLTLASGAAMANSSQFQCLGDQKYRPEAVERPECVQAPDPTDEAVRLETEDGFCLAHVDQDGIVTTYSPENSPGQFDDLVTHSCYTSFVVG
jgi:hypothetical protein